MDVSNFLSVILLINTIYCNTGRQDRKNSGIHVTGEGGGMTTTKQSFGVNLKTLPFLKKFV